MSNAAPTPADAPRVLLVDDEADFCRTVAAILARDGVCVACAPDAESALALAKAADPPFTVAILDLRLPGDDGLVVMHRLRSDHPAMRCLILTGYPSPATCRAALLEGAVAYLEKPLAPEALRALVATLLPELGED